MLLDGPVITSHHHCSVKTMALSPRLLRPRASGGGFSPLVLPSLGGWWDATDASSYTLDTGVSEWRDKSGRSQKFTQSTGASQPIINSTGINSRPTLEFDGSNDWMTLGSATIGGTSLRPESGNEFAVYFVARSAGNGVFLAQAVSSVGSRVLQIYRFGSDNFLVYGTVSAPAGFFPQSVSLLCGYSWDGSQATGRSNSDIAAITVGPGPVSDDVVTIGARTSASPAVFLSGRIGEIVFFRKSLSPAEESALFRYLNAKWGLSVT
jgi:hypothetical protein